MEYPLYNQKAENIGKIELPDSVFGVESNNDLLHQVVTSLAANKRQVIAHAKTRSEVRGGGRKPWRQKGTGRARHGSIRSPIWKGGGAAFGPSKDRNFKKKINKKMARKALLISLSSKARDGQLFVIDKLDIAAPKTKEMAVILGNFKNIFSGKLNNILIIIDQNNPNVKRSVNNLPGVNLSEVKDLNSLFVLSSSKLLVSKDAIKLMEKIWQGKKPEVEGLIKEKPAIKPKIRSGLKINKSNEIQSL